MPWLRRARNWLRYGYHQLRHRIAYGTPDRRWALGGRQGPARRMRPTMRMRRTFRRIVQGTRAQARPRVMYRESVGHRFGRLADERAGKVPRLGWRAFHG